MLLQMNGMESSVLLLQMSISRKNVKKTFKRNYSKEECETLLASFDKIKEALEVKVEQTSADNINEIIDYYFSDKETNLLFSYLENYTPLLEETLQQAGKILREDQQQIDILYKIKNNINKLEITYA